MDYDKFESIIDYNYEMIDGDWVWIGLRIIAKYTNDVIQGANHDIIYSESIEKLIEEGITEEEVIILSKCNWHIDEESLAHFV